MRGRGDPLARAWRDLVEHRLPQQAATRPDWPVHLDHCFARILLDHACNGPWRERVAAPAWAHMPDDQLEAAIALGDAVLEGRADLTDLNQRSLAWRGKTLRAKTRRAKTTAASTERDAR